MRMAGDFLAQALSMRITALLDKENHEQHRATLDLHVKLCDLMAAQVVALSLRVDALSLRTCFPRCGHALLTADMFYLLPLSCVTCLAVQGLNPGLRLRGGADVC